MNGKKNVVGSSCGLFCVLFHHLPEDNEKDLKKFKSGQLVTRQILKPVIF
jgi:hypothetical protein